jgi:hypothetical protein
MKESERQTMNTVRLLEGAREFFVLPRYELVGAKRLRHFFSLASAKAHQQTGDEIFYIRWWGLRLNFFLKLICYLVTPFFAWWVVATVLMALMYPVVFLGNDFLENVLASLFRYTGMPVCKLIEWLGAL